MRLHDLTVTAFGPFAGTERVDFDALNDAGLFLLSGATGAGKTSILDAVCFALYGTVPGARGVKVLKSQHAPEQVAPEVVLDFSVRDRRFVLRRSPEWTRPKRRGTGMITQKASASLTELTPDGEQFLTHRAAEVGLIVADLVGMRAAQFQQVALLPQGDFHRFLQASSQERHDVLQHLFQTDRFTRIEDWVHDHSRRLRDESESGERAVQRILATVADRVAVDLPEPFAAATLGEAATGASILAWAREQLASAEQQRASAAEAERVATLDLGSTEEALREARGVAAAVTRRDDARARLAALSAVGSEATAAEAALDADRRASACLPVLDLWDRTAAECDEASLGRIRAMAGIAGIRRAAPDDALLEDLLGDIRQASGVEDLETSERRARALLTRVEDLAPRVRSLAAARAALVETETAVAECRGELAGIDRARSSLPDTRQALADRLSATRNTAARREVLELLVGTAETRKRAAAALASAEARLARHQDAQRDARDRAADTRDRVQELTARRLDGVAAELAGALLEGRACQVCGSVDHPHPATSGTAPVTATEQEQAQAAHEEAEASLRAVTVEVTAAEQSLAELRHRADGRDAETAAAELEEITAQVSLAGQAGKVLTELEGRLAEVAAELEDLDRRAAELDVRLATLGQAERTHRNAIEALRASVIDVLGEEVDPGGVAGRIDQLRAVVGALGPARAAEQRHSQAAAALAEVERQTSATTAQHGFSSGKAARAAVLTDADRERLGAVLKGRTEEAALAEAVLADPEVAAAGDCPAPDVPGAEAALAAARQRAADTTRALHELEERVRALREQVGRLDLTVSGWTPMREVSRRAESMAKLVRGMGGDNQLQMRLSAYVLATRLDQVLAAANERLSQMRDQRYLLQRTGKAGRKGSQAGLGLEMIDQWTGDVREPATLSGGETFVVSLALALGLADVVTQEAGGTEIETLFVDEGFGTLDADTLDDVMDRLDSLRAGGRSVGVVSHVTELSTRIPTQLHVQKTPTGSSIRVTSPVG